MACEPYGDAHRRQVPRRHTRKPLGVRVHLPDAPRGMLTPQENFPPCHGHGEPRDRLSDHSPGTRCTRPVPPVRHTQTRTHTRACTHASPGGARPDRAPEEPAPAPGPAAADPCHLGSVAGAGPSEYPITAGRSAFRWHLIGGHPSIMIALAPHCRRPKRGPRINIRDSTVTLLSQATEHTGHGQGSATVPGRKCQVPRNLRTGPISPRG